MNLFDNIRNYFSYLNGSKIFSLIAFLVIVAAVPLTVFIAQRQQEIRQRASYEGDLATSPSCTNGKVDVMIILDAYVYKLIGINLAKEVVNAVKAEGKGNKVALVYGKVDKANKDGAALAGSGFGVDYGSVIGVLDADAALSMGGCVDCALRKANAEIQKVGNDGARKVVVLIDDGMETYYWGGTYGPQPDTTGGNMARSQANNAATDIKNSGAEIYSIDLISLYVYQDFLKGVATDANKYYPARGINIPNIYSGIIAGTLCPSPSPSISPSPSVSPSPSISPSPSPSVSPPVSPSPSVSPSTTETPVPGRTTIELDLKLQGISSESGTSENNNPRTTIRKVKIEIFNSAENQARDLVSALSGNVVFDKSTGTFTGSIPLPDNADSGVYEIKVTVDRYLRRLINNEYGQLLHRIVIGQPVKTQRTALIIGDINGDNRLNVIDYNIWTACYNKSVTTPIPLKGINGTCILADLNDDGEVGHQKDIKNGIEANLRDYQWLFSSFQVQTGD